MSSKIERSIEEIEQYLESCKTQLLSDKNIIVNRDEIEELVRELRMCTPEEIKKYQKILVNKEAILADAQAKADAIIKQANVQLNELVSEHEIMQEAYAQANAVVEAASTQAQQIMNKATKDAYDVQMNAMEYADEQLANIQTIIQNTIETYNSRYSGLVNSLNEYYEVVTANRNELAPSLSQSLIDEVEKDSAGEGKN